MSGAPASMRDLDVISVEIGPSPAGLDLTLPGHHPIGALRIGPTPTTVNLVDDRDNAGIGQAACEAIYVDTLIVESCATRNTARAKMHYNILTDTGTVIDLGIVSRP